MGEDQSSSLLPKQIQRTARKIATVAAALSPADALHFTIYQNDETLEIKIRRLKSLFFMRYPLKAKGPENPTPSPKRLKNHTRIYIAIRTLFGRALRRNLQRHRRGRQVVERLRRVKFRADHVRRLRDPGIGISEDNLFHRLIFKHIE